MHVQNLKRIFERFIMQDESLAQEARRLLYEYFGYSTFRPAQESLIVPLLNKKDVLGVMPTGAGKSICYQIPALIFPGITLVISPLISLMQDQVRSLKAAGIRGAYLNSSLTTSHYVKSVNNALQGLYKIIYVAPERLSSPEFLRFARQVDISMVAVDEAHCVSQWGHDFRPSYMDIAVFVEKLSIRPVVAAFTATATAAVRQDILQHLCLQNPVVQVAGFDRENLIFSVQRPQDKLQTLLEFLNRHTKESGIIYCSTRKKVEQITEQLQSYGFSVAAYHGGMDEDIRRDAQNNFLFDRIQVIVATNAFGMGIDKQNVTFVVHYNMPKNMEAYYQEAGRAGRDGLMAECLLLYGPGDVHTAEFLIRSSQEGMDANAVQARTKIETKKLEQMKAYCFTNGCLRHYILNYFGQEAKQRCDACGNCIAHKNIISTLRAKTSDPHQQENSLYDLLRSVRKDYAQCAQIPPELVFSDRTLQEMASRRPANEYEMLQIPGVSPVKYQKYGKTFLRIIQRNSRRRSGLE